MDSEFRILRAKTSKTRREEIDGDEFLVVPMVALRTGVYQCANCAEPEFYDADVFARIPESWNDRPVTLGHPMREGVFVSAGSDEVWRKEGMGRIRNARRDGDKLVLEAWLDLLKADEVGDEAAALIEALEDGTGVDVSVGAFVDTVARPGVHNSKAYIRTQLGYVPDHVAFLPGQVGACSWEDGCGAPRTNQAIEANLMTLQRDGGGQAVLPLTTSDSTCPCGGTDACYCDEAPAKVELLADSLTFKTQAMGDQARRQILGDALGQKLGDNDWWHVVEIFDATVVYQARGGTFSRDYSITEDGTVSLSDDPVQGALVAEFMPITVQQESTEMTERAKAVDGLIANEAAPWGEDDRQFLMDAGDDQFAKLAPPAEEPAANEGGEPSDEFPKVEIEPEPAANTQPAAMSAEEREIMDDALTERARARGDLISKITANEANQFTADELQGMQTNQLRKLAALSFTDANAGRPAGGNYAGSQPAASARTDIKHFADRPAEPDWTKRAH